MLKINIICCCYHYVIYLIKICYNVSSFFYNVKHYTIVA